MGQTSIKAPYNNGIVIDGDEIREIFKDSDYSDTGRYNHIMKCAKFASILEDQGFVVFIALVSPKAIWRKEAYKMFQEYKVVHVTGGELWPGSEYETPDESEMYEGITVNRE